MCPPTATPTPNPPPHGGGEHTERMEVPAADPPHRHAGRGIATCARSFARRACAAILMPNRNAIMIVEAHGPHCSHCADAARDRAGACRAGAAGGAAARCLSAVGYRRTGRVEPAGADGTECRNPAAGLQAALGCGPARIRLLDDRI